MNPGLALLTFFPSRVGGTETYIGGLLGAFSKGAGPEVVTALTSNLSDAFVQNLESEHLSRVRLPGYRSGNSDMSRLLAMQRSRMANSKLRSQIPSQVDLIHYPVTVPIPRVGDIPTVVTLADVQHHDLKFMFSPAERTYRRWAYDRSARQADAVITISNFSKARIEEALGIPDERIHVIPHAVDRTVFSPAAKLSASPSVPARYLLYPASGWPHKNHEMLFKAFSSIEDPELSLVLTGGNVHRLPPIKDSRVLHLGHVSTPELAGLYRGALGVVFPTLYEGFGLPALEAMACGCPVAISDTPALAEVCGPAALSIGPLDVASLREAMLTLATDDTLRSTLSARGIARASSFSWERSAAQHRSVYEATLR